MPIRIRIPASTSNLGPGFDTLGLALSLYLEVRAQPAKHGLKIRMDNLPKEYSRPLKAMVAKAAQTVFDIARIKPVSLDLHYSNNIPLARGLGSSAAIRLGAMTAANIITGNKLTREKILQAAAMLEGHPDNCVACFYGGISATGFLGGSLELVRAKVPGRIKFVTLIPEATIRTNQARRVLPASVTRKDSIFNMQRAIMLFHTLVNNPEGLCPLMFEDRLHQQARARLFKPLNAVINAAVEAGARGAFLSGSGSTIIAVVLDDDPQEVGQAMQQVLQKKNIPSRVMVLKADNRGLMVQTD